VCGSRDGSGKGWNTLALCVSNQSIFLRALAKQKFHPFIYVLAVVALHITVAIWHEADCK